MSVTAPYIARPETDEFLAALETALDNPNENPVVFHVWGIGGVGKSTLTCKVQERFSQAKAAKVFFERTAGIDEPIPLMAKLYEQIAPQDPWGDPFWTLYEQYFDTINDLKTQPLAGKAVGPEQVGWVNSLLKLGVDAAGLAGMPESGRKVAKQAIDRGLEGTVAALSVKDELQQWLQQHRATKRDQQLQRLMLDPLPQLTQAFVAALGKRSQQQPILLILDTYEKAAAVQDDWLWRLLLGNTNLSQHRVRLVVAGRHSLRKTEGWRKLHQDFGYLHERGIERFDEDQTAAYLTEIGITDADETQRVFTATRGLPYYLNWIREQLEQGRTLDFDQGNAEIVRLLLPDLNDVQKQVVQLAACCRWFNAKIIRYLTDQNGLDFASAADDSLNCYGWLIQRSFAEPVGKYWRLDDVARDVFRQSLDQDDLEEIHDLLSQYFLILSDQEVSADSCPSEKYDNADWRELRSEYLYHSLFTRQPEIQRQLVSHLLEASYFKYDSLVKTPFQAITAEFSLEEHPLLRRATRKMFQQLRPAILHAWAVLEKDPIDYLYNEKHYGFSVQEADTAIQMCLSQQNQLSGFTKLLELVYRINRCPEEEVIHWITEAKNQAEYLVESVNSPLLGDILTYEIGNKFNDVEAFEDAIAAYDAAIKIKPDEHYALNNKGNALVNLGRYEDAIAAYDAALKIKPVSHKVLYNKGNALVNLGRYEDAIAAYDAAIEIKPVYHEALNNKGHALFNLGLYKDAIAAYDAAIEIKPVYHKALNNKDNALGNLGGGKGYQDGGGAEDCWDAHGK